MSGFTASVGTSSASSYDFFWSIQAEGDASLVESVESVSDDSTTEEKVGYKFTKGGKFKVLCWARSKTDSCEVSDMARKTRNGCCMISSCSRFILSPAR